MNCNIRLVYVVFVVIWIILSFLIYSYISSMSDVFDKKLVYSGLQERANIPFNNTKLHEPTLPSLVSATVTPTSKHHNYKAAKLSTTEFKKDIDICGIACYYNPANFTSKLANYRIFRQQSKLQGLMLLTVELSFGESSFELNADDADVVVQLRTSKDNVLWQKERLLNLATQRIPSSWSWCKKIIWTDIELVFTNPDWLAQTSKALEQFVVVQPFSFLFRLSRTQDHESINVTTLKYSNARTGASKRVLNNQANHGFTGFVWAIRRSVLDQVHLFDYGVVGGGDALICHAIYGHFQGAVKYAPYYYEKHFTAESSDCKQAFHRYAAALYALTQGNVGYVDNVVLHLFHGEKRHRQYKERFEILKRYNFRCDRDVQLGPVDEWKWNGADQGMIRDIKRLFQSRKED